ncbi:MAG: hypothetical protein K2K29_06870 [Muribaculaceae bacterium]|nr:hypothetical protein [Muribaculaceae bacterium]
MDDISGFPYEDIVNLPHYVSAKRTPMPMSNRAVQFAPFAALTGHDAAINETARRTSKRVLLSSEEYSLLSRKLSYVMALEEKPEIKITYFKPDSRKAGGEYVTVAGYLKTIEEVVNMLILMDGTRISLTSIDNIEGDVFSDME